ncbi:hypothetical protein CsSME_00016912 [Camellia sinensis var. sinensis]
MGWEALFDKGCAASSEWTSVDGSKFKIKNSHAKPEKSDPLPSLGRRGRGDSGGMGAVRRRREKEGAVKGGLGIHEGWGLGKGC